ncbi:permease prefix domain 1-containing protein [Micromonospora sp. R77]|uniref:permease prefix domain 1-containing protein n=1 Tax=Micromonospora sp. R77 TaxID=2925836 RepID=UPI001F607273|nr:permease prefix domain 1-containing protein [Micromonospora sp. R77]MCI4064211.1 permease prefix domain 1-containing protein [Micromonospora sp. R77]
MGGCEDVRVQDRLRELSGRLSGPARLKADLLTEARHALLDAAEAYRKGGLSPAEAERRAVAEFGTAAQLAPAYQAELAAGASRGLAWRALVVALVLTVGGDLTWRGSSWSDGPRPPGGYLLLSAALNWIWLVVAALALAGLALAGWSARRGDVPTVVRAWGLGLTGVLVLGAGAGVGVFAWSVALWDEALTWPPMIIGAALVGTADVALGRAARLWLAATP